MDLHKTVIDIVGPVKPVGSTDEDARRLANLRNLMELIDELLRFQVVPVAMLTAHTAHSVAIAVKFAEDFLAGIPDSIDY